MKEVFSANANSENPHKDMHSLIRKVPVTAAADKILKKIIYCFYFFFPRRIMFDFHLTSAWQMIHMKCQVFISLLKQKSDILESHLLQF